MGWTVGMPSLKLNKAGLKSKHCGDFQSVAEEALQERKGHDPDIDPERAARNVYEGFETAADLMAYSDAHCSTLRDPSGRALRKDAVRMCATILKPPAAFMATLSEEDQKIFLQDGIEKIEEIVGKDNVKAKAWHFDEQGAHVHVFWEPMTEDGRLCAKELHNLQFFSRLNKEMPEHLRSRGWDIDDCNAYDMAAEDLKTEKEKAERRQKNGRSSAVYKAEAERQLQAINRTIGQTIDNLDRNVEAYTQEIVEAVANDQSNVYDNVMFLLATCDDDRFRELDQEGQDLKKEILKEVIDEARPKQALAQMIADIEAGKKKEITWQERQELWDVYNVMSNQFWELRAEIKQDYSAELNAAYQKRRSVMRSYYDAMYLLRTSRGFLSIIIATVLAIVAMNRENEINRQIDALRAERDLLVRNTASFKKFSNAYREDLKAGKMPGEDYMVAMAEIIKTLDREQQKFQAQGKVAPRIQHNQDQRNGR